MMTKQVMALVAVLTMLGCGRNLQRDVYNQLAESFRVPQEESTRDQFYTKLKQRCALPADAVFLSYDYRTAPFVTDDKELYVSAGVTVKGVARSPSNDMAYLIHEEWYAAQHNWSPLLLRRSVMQVDERLNETRHITDQVARRTVFEDGE